MIGRKPGVQITLDSTSITVLKEILYQVEQAKAKREQKRRVKDSTQDSTGQLSLLVDTTVTEEVRD